MCICNHTRIRRPLRMAGRASEKRGKNQVARTILEQFGAREADHRHGQQAAGTMPSGQGTLWVLGSVWQHLSLAARRL